MDGFLQWFFAFMTDMLSGLLSIVLGIFEGVVQIFNIPQYINQLMTYGKTFSVLDWIVAIFAFLLVFAIWAIIILILILLVRKYVRFRKTVVENEDILEELAELHRDVIKLTREKEQIMALKIGQTSIPVEAINEIFNSKENIGFGGLGSVSNANNDTDRGGSNKDTTPSGQRFFRLSAVDEKYEFYTPPEYRTDLSLSDICDSFRAFACTQMHLYYDIKTIRLMFAGLASTKLILLQGISGTGKTSLPYSMGKFFQNDATIAPVQPSWRDRTELFGYFNEFTKKFNETEVLKRIYEASYQEDVNIVVLDEMNIARVEYYFAEMLSILEMPDPAEWKIELVPSTWPSDPVKLVDGKLTIPQNVWYIGTANNDDSTFAVSDKVYDRALTINLDKKGVAFESPEVFPMKISYKYIESLYDDAQANHPMNQTYLDEIQNLDLYVIEKFRIAFGNRIMKQMKIFIPVYVACGGDEVDGIDYILATKVFRKFESLNLSLIRDEIDGLIDYLNSIFGVDKMAECIEYLERLKKTY